MVLLSQILVFVFGVSAFWFASGKTPTQRILGATLGLVGQPFWFIITIAAHQWFVMLLCCFYTFTWGRMLWNNLGDKDLTSRVNWFMFVWRSALIYVWYFKILGRRRAIRKDEDCEFYHPKDKKTRLQSFECWGDGHYECNGCFHYTPEKEPISEELL